MLPTVTSLHSDVTSVAECAATAAAAVPANAAMTSPLGTCAFNCKASTLTIEAGE